MQFSPLALLEESSGARQTVQPESSTRSAAISCPCECQACSALTDAAACSRWPSWQAVKLPCLAFLRRQDFPILYRPAAHPYLSPAWLFPAPSTWESRWPTHDRRECKDI